MLYEVITDMTDNHITNIDEITKDKEKEILAV